MLEYSVGAVFAERVSDSVSYALPLFCVEEKGERGAGATQRMESVVRKFSRRNAEISVQTVKRSQ